MGKRPLLLDNVKPARFGRRFASSSMKRSTFTPTQIASCLVGGSALAFGGIAARPWVPQHGAWAEGAALVGLAALGAGAWAAWRAGSAARREAESKARELAIAEERHRMLLAQASDAILLSDADTEIILQANRAVHELLGWTAEELIGQRHTLLYPTEDRDAIRCAFMEHAQRGGIVERELMVRRRSGESIPMQVSVTLIAGSSRRYLQAILRDLRPRLRSEEALRRSETRLRDIFERAPVAILEEDFTAVGEELKRLRQNGVEDLSAHLRGNPQVVAELFGRVRITRANPTALRAAGAPDIETYARLLPNSVTPEVLNAFRLELEALWQDRNEVVCEIAFRREDGSIGHSVMHWSVTRADDGLDLARVVVVFSDLSQLRAAEARLREIEDRWELAVRALNVGIFEKDYRTGEIFFSDRWKEILGFRPEELANLKDEWQARIHPEDRADVLARLQSHLRQETDYYAAEYRMLRKNGDYAWVQARGWAIFDRDGNPQRLIGAHADVSASKAAEVAMRASEERYRELFERTPIAILEEDFTAVGEWLAAQDRSDPQWLERNFASWEAQLRLGYARIRLLAANRSALAYLSARSVEELAPRKYQNPPLGILIAFREVLLAIRAGHDEVTCDVQFADAQGRTCHQLMRWSAARRHGHLDLSRVRVVMIDTTERKEAETAIRESEARYRVLFEHSPVGLLEYDYQQVGLWLKQLRATGVTDLAAYLDGHPVDLQRAFDMVRLVGVNQETVRMARAKSKEELMANLPHLFTGEVYAARRQAFLAIWEDRREIEGEITLHTLEGTDRRIYYRWWLPRLEGEETLEWTQVVLVDLTDIRSTEAELAAERERLRVTLRAMAEGLLTTDTRGVVQFMNDAAERITGWPASAAIGRPIEEICVLRHEKTRAEVAVPVAQAISEHRVVEFPLQTALVNRAGVTCLIDGRCAPMHDLNGRAIGIVVVVRDITERSRLEAELLRSSKLESVGILAGGIAHDFNNILTVVMGNVTLAMLDSGVMAAAGRWLEEAERGVMRARDLTQQLLTFAKGGEPVRKAVQLPEIVREAAEFALHGSKVRSEFEIEPHLWPADVDKAQIGQVVHNLVINAVQAMPEGGVVKIALRNDHIAAESPRPLQLGSYLRLTISDSGMGIRAEHLSRIFDPYFTTKQAGSGLGLATVYSVVRRHQGHIDVDSELGKGTTFRIWLPAAPDAQPIEKAPPAQVEPLAGRVLFMDDEEVICGLAETLLGRLGLEVMTVRDGRQALDAYVSAREEKRPFDLVIMDLTIPGGMGGAATMKALLEIDPQVRAIVSSGYSSDPVLSNYRAHGFRGMVPKPYKLADLARTIATVLDSES